MMRRTLVIATLLVSAAAAQPEQPTTMQPAKRYTLMHREWILTKDKAAVERWDAIVAELEALGDRAALKDDHWAKKWVGQYGHPSGFHGGLQLVIAPKGGVMYEDAAGELHSWFAHGPIVSGDAEGVTVRMDRTGEASTSPTYISERIHFVRWGEQRLAIADGRMGAFLNACNQKAGHIPKEWSTIDPFEQFCLRVGDRKKERTGQPKLPSKFAGCLLSAPLTGTITAVNLESKKGGRAIGTATVDVGSERGAYAGLPLRVRVDGKVQTLEVAEVRAGSCTAKFDFDATAMGDAEPPVVNARVGTLEP